MLDLEFIRELARRAQTLAQLADGQPWMSAELKKMAAELQRWADKGTEKRTHNGRRVYTIYL